MGEGKQLLPAPWVDGVRKANVDMREHWAQHLRYGSQFWVMPGRDADFAVGYGRRLIVVMPKLEIVAVMTGSARFPTANGMPTKPRYSFDAHRRYGLSAARVTWLDDGVTLVLDALTLGDDNAARATHLFSDKSVEVKFESADGLRATLTGRTDD